MSTAPAVIIGGGLAGLSAGIYLGRNGSKAIICENAPTSGGVSVSWKRKGYTFDGATNWVPGSTPALNFHKTLCEILDFSQFEWIDFDIFETVEHPDGDILTVYKNADRLEQELVRIAPGDAGKIHSFMQAVRRVRKVTIPVAKPFDLYSPLDWAAMPFTNTDLIVLAVQWKRFTIDSFTATLQSEKLRWFLRHILPHHGAFSVLALITSLGWLCMRAAGYPIGGSARLAGALEKRFTDEGGSIRFNTRVTRILTEKGRVCGIELANGEQIETSVVFAACDSRATIYELLGSQFTHPAHERAIATWPVFPSMLQLSYGISRPLPDSINKSIFTLDEPIAMGNDHAVAEVIVRVCNFDPTFAPQGCTAVVANLRTTDWQYWHELREHDLPRYKSEKERVAAIVLSALEKRLGPLREHCAVTDVATPATYIRYNRVWQGSYQGWFPSPGVIGKSLPITLHGLTGLYLTGQWVVPPGGIARVMVAARHAVQMYCRDQRKAFTAQVA